MLFFKLIKQKEYLIPAFLTVVAAFSRLLSLGTMMVTDEPAWITRGISFGVALKELNFSGTVLAGHPGVPAMWLSALGAGLTNIFRGVALIGFSGDFGQLLYPDQLLFALVGVITIPVSFLLLKRLFGLRIAFLASLLIALDPFLIAHSRIIHVDALLFNFVYLAILLFLVYLKTDAEKTPDETSTGFLSGGFLSGSNRALLGSGAMAGLAILTKTPSIILIPFVLVIFFVLKKNWRDFLIWIAALGLIMFALWPALWVDPIAAVSHVIERNQIAIGESHHSGTYELNPTYYFESLVFYLTPITLFFLGIALLVLLFEIREMILIGLRDYIKSKPREFYVVLTLGFILILLAVMTIGAKKSHRYFAPAYPLINLLVAFTIFKTARFIDQFKPTLTRVFWGAITILLLFQVVGLVKLHPYYLAYYNPILASPTQAKMGWGEGLDLAAEYLNQKENAQDLIVSSWYPEVFGTFFNGTVRGLDDRNQEEIDYVVVYKGMLGRGEDSPVTATLEEYYPDQIPDKIIYINGLEYVWIYLTESMD